MFHLHIVYKVFGYAQAWTSIFCIVPQAYLSRQYYLKYSFSQSDVGMYLMHFSETLLKIAYYR